MTTTVFGLELAELGASVRLSTGVGKALGLHLLSLLLCCAFLAFLSVGNKSNVVLLIRHAAKTLQCKNGLHWD